MKLVTDARTGGLVRREISQEELLALSGVSLAALLAPCLTKAGIATINRFPAHYNKGAMTKT